ncbi:hypothetical protein [Rhodopseudomonas telluris]|uniref:Uncharacterized protein n=1 Tax=Rhodopseudomonas telluris TaxID=644215 RepID=A0ABV6EVU5_9BRAD
MITNEAGRIGSKWLSWRHAVVEQGRGMINLWKLPEALQRDYRGCSRVAVQRMLVLSDFRHYLDE